ncbi:MAG TPA: DUF3043 domain-containing protein [Propionibacteriaceae bacterium]|nr:DUF3043 domain-containing protein [Propionibacteriaceae bacterium]
MPAVVARSRPMRREFPIWPGPLRQWEQSRPVVCPPGSSGGRPPGRYPAQHRKAPVALFRRSTPAEPAPEPTAGRGAPTGGPSKKARPTPTRKEAEAARRQRVTRTVSKKEARAEAARAARVNRMRTLNLREGTPEKTLLRDYIDARFSIGELLLPSLVVILATTFLNQLYPAVTLISTLLMYLFILLILVDVALMWRGFKKVLAKRLPHASTKGLVMYGMNRCIQIRRFRMPPPRIKRGDSF